MVQRCERLFERYGSFTIFFARFVAGLRIVAGPLAGISGMSWRKFALWNLLGAMAWVTVISLVGYFVGRNWNTLVEFVRRLDTLIVVIAAAVILLVWRRKRGKTSS
jgi:membrane-associated protein